jgi:hypothetical protein
MSGFASQPKWPTFGWAREELKIYVVAVVISAISVIIAAIIVAAIRYSKLCYVQLGR